MSQINGTPSFLSPYSPIIPSRGETGLSAGSPQAPPMEHSTSKVIKTPGTIKPLLATDTHRQKRTKTSNQSFLLFSFVRVFLCASVPKNKSSDNNRRKLTKAVTIINSKIFYFSALSVSFCVRLWLKNKSPDFRFWIGEIYQ